MILIVLEILLLGYKVLFLKDLGWYFVLFCLVGDDNRYILNGIVEFGFYKGLLILKGNK